MVLHYEFIKTAKKYPKKMAIHDRSRNSDVTFEKALLAALLLKNKFKSIPEKYVGVMVPNSAGAMLAVLGILMNAKVPVMINYSTGAEENCHFALKKCRMSTIITSRALLEKINCPLLPSMVCLEDIMKEISIFAKIRAAIKVKNSAEALINSLPRVTENDISVILFTSGSEKDPKAVPLTHNNIFINYLDAKEAFGLTEEDSILCILPLFHVFGFMTQFWLPLLLGMTAITYGNPLEYKTVAKIIKEYKPTMAAATPIFFGAYVRVSQPGDFSSLRLVVPGADKVPHWLRKQYMEKHGIELLEGYGTTETSPVISANRPGNNKPGSIGLPFTHVKVKIAGIDDNKELPPGEEGKILVQGESVMKGYWEDPEANDKAFIDGWYDTGDIGVIDEAGFLWHRGRLKRFIKIGGELVSLVRTESVLEKFLPENMDFCAVEVPDSLKGAKIAAVVSGPIDEDKLKAQLLKELPALAVPFRFLVLEEFPKMGSGKADFRKITEIALDMLKK
ncbi:MAG: AMP-binding protein [Spirochaetales bacterium]|nr:AMP-binding protein [Spirochaetales bacterium]